MRAVVLMYSESIVDRFIGSYLNVLLAKESINYRDLSEIPDRIARKTDG